MLVWFLSQATTPAVASSSLDSNVMPAGGLDSNVTPTTGIDANAPPPRGSMDSNLMPAGGMDSNRMPKSGMDSNVMPATGSDSNVDPRLCQALVAATPSPDTAYQPGVDVHGHKVVSADVPGGTTIKLPDKIQIPLTISLAKVLNLNTSTYPYNQLGPGTEANIGMITVEGNRAFFNGQPLSDAQQDNLAVLCMKKTN